MLSINTFLFMLFFKFRHLGVTFVHRLRSREEHCITETEKSVLHLHSRLIRAQNESTAGEGADQHDKRRLRQVEVRDNRVDDLKIVARVDEDPGPAAFTVDDIFRLGGGFERAD